MNYFILKIYVHGSVTYPKAVEIRYKRTGCLQLMVHALALQ
jgi:hypothetical protein